MENLTYVEMIAILKKMTCSEILEAIELDDPEVLIEAVEDHLMEKQEAVIENLFEMGVV